MWSHSVVKSYLPLPDLLFFAYLSHLHDLDYQTNTTQTESVFLNDDFIYLEKKMIQTYLALCDKVFAPLLNSLINCDWLHFLESWVQFTSHTQVWLLQ